MHVFLSLHSYKLILETKMCTTLFHRRITEFFNEPKCTGCCKCKELFNVIYMTLNIRCPNLSLDSLKKGFGGDALIIKNTLKDRQWPHASFTVAVKMTIIHNPRFLAKLTNSFAPMASTDGREHLLWGDNVSQIEAIGHVLLRRSSLYLSPSWDKRGQDIPVSPRIKCPPAA